MKKKNAPAFLVSQSMLKDWRRYKKKELCGLILKAKYIDKTYPVNADDSDAKRLGRYFEFILTGSTGRDGIEPQPDWYESALKKEPRLRKVDDMKKPYQLAHKNAERVKVYFKKMKIKVIEVNVRIQRGGMEGTIDVIATYKGQRIVIDVKYSGLIDNRFDEMGWTMTDEQKNFHGVQAHQYHYLTLIPFFFLVVSSTNEDDILFIEAEFTEFSKEQHEVEIEKVRTDMLYGKDFAFIPYPELVRCKNCAIAAGCPVKTEVPIIKKVNFQT